MAFRRIARGARVGERFGAAIRALGFCRYGCGGADRDALPGRAAGAGADRNLRSARYRRIRAADEAHPRAGGQHRDRRFRGGLLVVELSAPAAREFTQDRSVVPARSGRAGRFGRGGAGHRAVGAQHGIDGGRRRRRNGAGTGLLRAAGCDKVQGHLYGEPLREKEVRDLLAGDGAIMPLCREAL